jgi:hypothetical protein
MLKTDKKLKKKHAGARSSAQRAVNGYRLQRSSEDSTCYLKRIKYYMNTLPEDNTQSVLPILLY